MSNDTDFGSYVAAKEAAASAVRRTQMDSARTRARHLHDEHFGHVEREADEDVAVEAPAEE